MSDIIEIDEVLHKLNLQIRRKKYARQSGKQLMKGVRKVEREQIPIEDAVKDIQAVENLR